MPANGLPIDAHLPRALQLLSDRGALVLTAEPGAGKTTRLPPALLAGEGDVWVLEPRRLAARLAARRVAFERNERVGETVGYQVRFDKRTSADTRLVFVTEGTLVRRLSGGEDALRGIGAVVLDEFHERHVETDLALTLVERLRRGPRPDLKLVVMSATLDAQPLADYLDAPVLEVEGRLHPVEIEHAGPGESGRLEDQVRAAVDRLTREGLTGHVLVFLPGAGEIKRCEQALAPLARAEDLAIFPLHGQLEADAIDAALRTSERRKVLLATNVAESSVTIDGVEAVIDSGLARVAGSSASTGLRTLELQPISKASAIQRANRAGRQGPGRCLRLYSRVDFERRPRAPIPELLREDLSGPLLQLRASGVVDLEEVRWLDPPPAPALADADALLLGLGATEDGVITDVGRDLLRYPLSPRLARVVTAGAERGVGEAAATAAALLSERSIRTRDARDRPAESEGPSDVLALLDLFEEARAQRFEARKLRRLDVDARAARGVDRVRQQLLRVLKGESKKNKRGSEHDLLFALLAGHPDRVARRSDGDRLVLASGGAARLAPSSVVGASEWMIVLDAVQTGQRGGRTAKARLASAIQPDWLLELGGDLLREEHAVEWDAERERVDAMWKLLYGQLVLDSSAGDADSAVVSAALRDAALAAGPGAFLDADALDGLQRRLRFARQFDESLPELNDDAVRATLTELCDGRKSFKELRQADLLAHLRTRLDHAQTQRLNALAPTHVTLHGGRRCQVTYEDRQPPWIKSRLQDFFSMPNGPSVGGGNVPVVMHLLAPNKTAVSVTADLASFWATHYPVERKRLSRRYPKHLWPEDPLTAKPPKPGRIR